ncbi:topoisomerase [Glycomyces buryatensis]|uniref:Topoisomerase n=1 Tax=Glycomyces buryatensis TaxID=2570927 RepID=A0A4S8Q629_9ACTN|nr:topoisomerase [Glycomyces buryatensis]THV35724.1 topoisomerase [Glycomyces buryatensis]
MADSPAFDYVANRRGITDPALIRRLGLGYVGEPSTSHERFQGMLAVPYLRHGYSGPNVTTIRFACIADDCAHEHHDKISSLPGHGVRLYNTRDLLAPADEICICLGEWDTITALTYGLHAVGVQSVTGWKPYMAQAFQGYKKVRIFTRIGDRDQSMQWANELAAQIPAAIVESHPVARGEPAALRP